MAPKKLKVSVLAFPVVVLVDQQEGLPYTFEGLISDADEGRLPLAIATETVHLKTGDYSLRGFESRISVERKGGASHGGEDLFRTLGQDRDRFEREIQRLNEMEFGAVVVETSWARLLADPPPHSDLNPKTVFRTVIAWQQRYPRVHWWFLDSRRLAEVTTFRILSRFYQTNGKRPD